MRKTPILTVLFLSLALLISPIAAAIPYTPSYLLVSPRQNESFAYLFLSSESEQKTQFLSLNISSGVDASHPQYTSLLDDTPFQTNGPSAAFVPVIGGHGTIKVYAGDCHKPGQAVVWHFEPNITSPIGNGTWTQILIHGAERTSGGLPGPNYLASGFAYSATNTTDSSVYTFGGMCPFHDQTSQSWVSAANYSRSMTVLEPPESDGNSSYEAATVAHRAPPIAEAGFSLTPLQPAHDITSSGSMLVQQNFLLIGGQTQTAFINMSELAIFSLPEKSWSFVNVHLKQALDTTNLRVRDVPAVEPRSGHSAVLTPDGTKVIIFGGWVGDTNTPAEPQLVVLEIGEMYGGHGPWIWDVPSMTSFGLNSEAGIYGHGATMLPGGVMMVAGGYTISHNSKRSAAGPSSNSQVYLYNVTSNDWVKSYTNPDVQALGAHNSESGSLSSGQKAGLGIGLGLGLPIAVFLVLLGLWLFRRRRSRERRDQYIRKLASGAERAHSGLRPNDMAYQQMRQPGALSPEYPWTANRGYMTRPTWREGDVTPEKTSLLMDVPSFPRQSRYNFGPRNYQWPGHNRDFWRSDTTGTTGDIHPIDERDEYESDAANNAMRPLHGLGVHGHELGDRFDPFAGSPVLAPTYLTSQNFNAGLDKSSGTDIMPVLGLRDKSGCSSPEKDERTSSDLSESSANSIPAKSESLPRPSRSTVFTSLPPSSLPGSGRQSPEKPGSTYSKETCRNSWDSMGLVEKHHSSDSFSTANTTFSQRQAEGEQLLRDSEPVTLPGSPSKARPKTNDWFGSIRRVFTISNKLQRNKEPSSTSVASGIDRSSTVMTLSKPFAGSETNTPTPKRAVSASAELFQRKQGARDWSAGNRPASFQPPKYARDDLALTMEGNEEDDWDVETAAEGRRVQVTFTVPKEKLRVVNATDEDMDAISEKSLSRNNSERIPGAWRASDSTT